MRYWTKVYRVEMEVLVAVCDEELLGQVFEEGELVLDVREEFYGGERLTESEVLQVLREATIANLTGRGAVRMGIKAGVIDRRNVLKVQGIPHAQMVRM
ncbi:MAG: DUF424 family protein [Euryarchaeota archaeon]|nr:DUF424 family protein [Euryarchaeota archaeon]